MSKNLNLAVRMKVNQKMDYKRIIEYRGGTKSDHTMLVIIIQIAIAERRYRRTKIQQVKRQ